MSNKYCAYLVRLFKPCAIGWVDFALFWNFIKSHGFEVPQGTIWRTTNFFDLSLKTSESYPFKGPYLNKNQRVKKKIHIFCMCSLMPILYSRIIKS